MFLGIMRIYFRMSTLSSKVGKAIYYVRMYVNSYFAWKICCFVIFKIKMFSPERHFFFSINIKSFTCCSFKPIENDILLKGYALYVHLLLYTLLGVKVKKVFYTGLNYFLLYRAWMQNNTCIYGVW